MTWWVSPRGISGLAVGHEIWFGWFERTLSPFCKTLKGINHTKANDASVIFQRMTLLLVSQATLKGRNVYLTCEVRGRNTYLIQLYLTNVASQLSKAIFR